MVGKKGRASGRESAGPRGLVEGDGVWIEDGLLRVVDGLFEREGCACFGAWCVLWWRLWLGYLDGGWRIMEKGSDIDWCERGF